MYVRYENGEIEVMEGAYVYLNQEAPDEEQVLVYREWEECPKIQSLVSDIRNKAKELHNRIVSL